MKLVIGLKRLIYGLRVKIMLIILPWMWLMLLRMRFLI